MARTIGRHLPRSSPRDESVALCAYCGVHWLRSKLHRDEAGNLVCPDEGTGRDVVQLSRENQEMTRKRSRFLREQQGGYVKEEMTGLVTLESVLMNGVKALPR